MSTKRILLIDDDLDEHDIFENAVKELGEEYSFMALSCSKQALQALKSFEVKPDIIFLDRNMNGMTGEDFLFALEACEPLQAIPVVIYTGSLTYSNISPGWPGVKYALEKPGSFFKLVESLSPLLKGSNSLINK